MLPRSSIFQTILIGFGLLSPLSRLALLSCCLILKWQLENTTYSNQLQQSSFAYSRCWQKKKDSPSNTEEIKAFLMEMFLSDAWKNLGLHVRDLSGFKRLLETLLVSDLVPPIRYE